MMNHEDLRTLLEYHYWARDWVLAAVEALSSEQFTRDLGSSFRSLRDTLAHLVAAEEVWLLRWKGQSPDALRPAEHFPDLASVRRAWAELEQQVRAFLAQAGEEGVGRVISYRLIGGNPDAAPFGQMLQHLVNHASYHRGQVTTMLRQLGAAPPAPMDLIAFYRQHKPSTSAQQ